MLRTRYGNNASALQDSWQVGVDAGDLTKPFRSFSGNCFQLKMLYRIILSIFFCAVAIINDIHLLLFAKTKPVSEIFSILR